MAVAMIDGTLKQVQGDVSVGSAWTCLPIMAEAMIKGTLKQVQGDVSTGCVSPHAFLMQVFCNLKQKP